MLLKTYNKQQKLTKKEKELEEDYKYYCEIFGEHTDEEWNKRYKKNYLLK